MIDAMIAKAITVFNKSLYMYYRTVCRKGLFFVCWENMDSKTKVETYQSVYSASRESPIQGDRRGNERNGK